MKKTAQTDTLNAQDDLEVLFQEMFGRRLDVIKDQTLNQLEEISKEHKDLNKKLHNSLGDLDEKVDDSAKEFGRQLRKAEEDLDKRLNLVSEKIAKTETELLNVMADNLKHLNNINTHSKEEMIALIASLAEPMARIDNLELEQEKLTKSLSIIKSGFDEIKQDLSSLGIQMETNSETNIKQTQILVVNAKDEIVKDITQLGKGLEQSSSTGFNVLQNKLSTGFNLSQKLIEDSKHQTDTLMEDYHQSLIQQSHEKALEINKQLNQFTNYGKALLAVNILGIVGIFILIYLLLIAQ